MNTHTHPISNLYKLLSIGFRYPSPEIFKTFQNGDFPDEKDGMKGMSLAAFEIEFTRIFDAGSPIPVCSPYEGHYCKRPRSMVMLEVSDFYNFFGLRMSQEEDKREFPDHICAELEFLHFLTFREEEALREDKVEELKGYLLAHKDFLEHHMITWIPEFCLKLQYAASLPFYAWLAQITSCFISSEFELMTENYT